jgi:xanthine dehydrogenase YagT iron-sulfur-binding subunit
MSSPGTVTPARQSVGSDQRLEGSSSSGKETLAARSVRMTVNGRDCTTMVEPRTTLLEALRGALSLTGTKKGCGHSECGACTVHVDGRRVLSCMRLAAMQEGKRITTIEGLEQMESSIPCRPPS